MDHLEQQRVPLILDTCEPVADQKLPDSYEAVWLDGYGMDIGKAAEEGVAILTRESSQLES